MEWSKQRTRHNIVRMIGRVGSEALLVAGCVGEVGRLCDMPAVAQNQYFASVIWPYVCLR